MTSTLRLQELSPDFTPDKLPEMLFAEPYFVLLESSPLSHGRYSIAACNPDEVFSPSLEETDPFSHLRSRLSREILTSELPFAGGWIGYWGYEAYPWFIPKVPSRSGDLIGPAAFGWYDPFYLYDHLQKKAWCAWLTPRPSGIAEKLLSQSPPTPEETPSICSGSNLRSSLTSSEYKKFVRQIQEYILDGDCYQINLSQRFQADVPNSADSIYRSLRKISPAPYSAYLNLGESQILSASPESFLEINGRDLITRPIKGTRRRGNTPEEDQLLKDELATSAKDRAELLMITDLERNDLGRVCEPGSIHVPILRDIETFPQVHHLVSTIRGRLLPQHDGIDAFRAIFPGGSITGAPKIRAMQIIRELEPHARDVYCGGIGYLSTNGKSQWNIAIRTMIFKNKKTYFYGGGGIVADSDPDEEYKETLSKTLAFFEALGLQPP